MAPSRQEMFDKPDRVLGMEGTLDGTVMKCGYLLRQALGDKVLSARINNSRYDEANTHRWSTSSVLSPEYIVRPETTEDVSITLNILLCGKFEGFPACPFAIKAGGHTAFPGANNIDGGITIDLSRMNEVKLSADRKIASLGPGNSWRNVGNKLHGSGVTVGGGRCADTGVGGVTLGGGVSFFSPKVGFVANNVVNYEIVLANGTVVNATAETHADLFKALKGGGSNFGIVTRFDILTMELPHFWAGSIIAPVTEQSTKLALAQLHSIAANHKDFPESAFGTIFHYNEASPFAPVLVWNSLVHYGENINELAPSNSGSRPNLILPFPDVMVEADFPTVLAGGDPMWPWGQRNLLACITFVSDPTAISRVHEISSALYETVRHIPGVEWLFAYEPFPYLYTEHALAHGGNVLGLERKKQDLILMQLVPRWTRAEDDAAIRKAAETWASQTKECLKGLGKDSDFLYLNYSDGFQDPISTYGVENISFLRSVAAKYDPARVFQTALKGTFKLPAMPAQA